MVARRIATSRGAALERPRTAACAVHRAGRSTNAERSIVNHLFLCFLSHASSTGSEFGDQYMDFVPCSRDIDMR